MQAHSDGQLSAPRRAFARMHLALCKECERLYRSLQTTVSLLSELKDEPIDEVGS